mmetsp:Transcript_117534/g.240394  ORF Transcript_117534/g.240394 Transcript_117534/m.240394 type:complete len:82 (+) Transcript_117534:747-992(+)
MFGAFVQKCVRWLVSCNGDATSSVCMVVVLDGFYTYFFFQDRSGNNTQDLCVTNHRIGGSGILNTARFSKCTIYFIIIRVG